MNDRITQLIRESYDRLADEYACRIFNELQHKPLDRELLDRFAVKVVGRGEVCDVGCGPGQVARYLRDAGAAVFGLDLSPRMLEQARQLNPDISFRVGNMMSLDLPDGTLAGIAAFYAIVNIPMESLPSVFREMQRILQPGGLLLLAFHSGDEIIHEDELWGRPISMDFFLFQPLTIRHYVEAAGFAIEEIIERDPRSTNTLRSYVNGIKDGSEPSIAGYGNVDYTNTLFIGSERTDLSFFDGTIDDVRVYNRALTAAEITALYNYTGAGGSGCSNPAGVEGNMFYNSDLSVMQYCNNERWVRIGQ